MAKKIFYSILAIFAILQLFQPDRNISSENLKSDLANYYDIPNNVESLLNSTCYDCHSNNTDYPWFINIQPIGWYMQSKINKGKSKLNFSEFGLLSTQDATEKLDEIQEVMNKNTMPLHSYKWYNKDADITIEQRDAIAQWALNLSKQISNDSTAALNKDTSLLRVLH
ncbi:MAG: heme-binding domain-containing protein [Chitinophagaceae bacterium]|nr:heme-binding domain-containing protein [Chitinophagaceae bacterium]MCW5905859.1 heme-binding domain-containing protein [Chitinophagaceae bacterium]